MKSIMLFSFILSFFGFGCTKVPEEEVLLHKVIGKHEKVQAKKKMKCIGVGGKIPDKIKGYNLHFISFEKLDLEGARRLLIESVENLIELTNQEVAMRPYLDRYPFDYKNNDYIIAFYDQNGEWLLPPFIASAILTEGKIDLSIYENNELVSVGPKYETYEEALEKVKKQACSE
jgi:hypothetical protein